MQPQAAGARNSGRKWLWIGLTVALFALLLTAGVVSLGRATEGQPRVTSVFQLTYDGKPKVGSLLTDGHRIFFSELVEGSNRLFSVPVSGGEPSPLNVPLANWGLEDISRDGSKLLLSSYPADRYSLWAYSLAAGSLERLCAGFAHGSVAPDGELAAVQVPKFQGDTSSIVIFGQPTKAKIDLPGLVGHLRWAPDGTKLRFSLQDVKRESSSEWEMNRQGLARRITAISDGQNVVDQGSWSRDGKYFAYRGGTLLHWDIWVLRESFLLPWLGRRKPYRLTNGGPGAWASPVFSYDASTIFATNDFVRSELVRFDQSTNSWLPEWGAAAAFELDHSRDRKWVVYTRFPDHTIWKASPDGTRRLQLTDGQAEAHQPHWSPDGTRIAFMAKNAKGQWRVMQVAANGGKAEELLPDGEDQGVAPWSAEGASLIFGDFPGRRPRTEMCVHELDVKTRRLSDVPGSKGLWSPRWSPNGKYIAAITSESSAVGVLPWGKTEYVALARMGFVDNATWSADSRHIYFNGTSEAGEKGLFRVSVPKGRLERIADMTGFDAAPENWYGVTPEGTPLAFHAVMVQEIFALKCELP